MPSPIPLNHSLCDLRQATALWASGLQGFHRPGETQLRRTEAHLITNVPGDAGQVP